MFIRTYLRHVLDYSRLFSARCLCRIVTVRCVYLTGLSRCLWPMSGISSSAGPSLWPKTKRTQHRRAELTTGVPPFLVVVTVGSASDDMFATFVFSATVTTRRQSLRLAQPSCTHTKQLKWLSEDALDKLPPMWTAIVLHAGSNAQFFVLLAEPELVGVPDSDLPTGISLNYRLIVRHCRISRLSMFQCPIPRALFFLSPSRLRASWWSRVSRIEYM